jgi:Zn-dependent protease
MNIEVIIGLGVLIFSAILHEIMHGVAAEKLGDPTARLAGRITLNPIPHIDPIMTILLPAILLLSGSPIIFGAAKPVPVNPVMLKDGRKDLALVALAGPATNLFLALVGALLLKLFGEANIIFTIVLQFVVIYNVVLGLLNLIPIPPLDGSKFFTIILPEEMALKYQSLAPFGIFLLISLLFFTPVGDWFRVLIVQSLKILGAL